MMLVAQEPGGQIHGYIALLLAVPEAELLRIVTQRIRRRQGIGSRLLASALGRLARLGVHTCYLEVRPSNQAARGLYAGQGFIPCGTRPGYFRGPLEDALVLKKEMITVQEEG
jgi:ribosomal-protein-alanine N-acetyltransferase